MIIPCVSCESVFWLDNIYIKAVGSRVRCSKCQDIFTIYPPEHNELSCSKNKTLDGNEAVVIRDAKHSHLDDHFPGVIRSTEMAISAGKSEKLDNSSIERIETTDDSEELAEDINIEYSGLPDISEIETMVDSILDERDYINDISPNFLAKYSLTQDLNISCV